MSIFINWVNFGLSNKIIFPVVDPKVIWFGSEWLNFTRDHFGSVKVTLLSGTYFVSVNLYSSDTYLIIYGTLNDILTKHFRRMCHVWYFAAIRVFCHGRVIFPRPIMGQYHQKYGPVLLRFRIASSSLDQFWTCLTIIYEKCHGIFPGIQFLVSRIYFNLSRVYNNLFSRVHLHPIWKLQPLFMYFLPPPDGAVFLEIVFKLCLNFI